MAEETTLTPECGPHCGTSTLGTAHCARCHDKPRPKPCSAARQGAKADPRTHIKWRGKIR